MDFKRMLPGEAKRALIQALFEKLENAKVNYRGQPIYGYAQALGDFRDLFDGWNPLPECYEEAKRLYDEKYPQDWIQDREHLGYRSIRKGIPEDQHLSFMDDHAHG